MQHGYRADITGLRTVAVALVLLYHAGVPGFGGGFVGVDVFFVVSGFLITGLLVRELETTGRINLWQFYARRARRLLPASFVVLAFIGSIVFIAPRWLPGLALPQIYGRNISFDIQRSALYIVNWLFAERSVSYQSSDDFGSPVLHFWSLAVEEQFYAVWPLVVIAVGALTARSTRALGVVIAVVTAVSLVHSWQFSRTSPVEAYFVTTTRIWEMALGGLLAIAAPAMCGRLNQSETKRLRRLVTFGSLPIGFGAITYGATQFSETTLYPGTAALIPTLGTVLILFVGALAPNGQRALGTSLLEIQPMQWLGDRSYSVYLWHWPALWLATAVLGPVGWRFSLLVVAASILPAAASYRWIEMPIRHGVRFSGRSVAAIGGAALLTVSGYALGAILLFTTTNISNNPVDPEPITTEVAGVQLVADDIVPALANLEQDLPAGYETGCFGSPNRADIADCAVGSANAETTIVAVGNSHLAHWAPALDDIADRRNWRIIYVHREGCRVVSRSNDSAQCDAWRSQVFASMGQLVTDTQASAILVTPQQAQPQVDAAESARLYTAAYDELSSHGVPLIAIAPTPEGPVVGVDCPTTLVSDLSACAADREAALAHAAPIETAATNAGAHVVDMTKFFCDESWCPAVINDIYVRRDSAHLTRTYAAALSGALEEELLGTLPKLAGS